MKSFFTLSLVASLSLVAAEMQVMSVSPAAAAVGAATHTVVVGGVKPAATGGVVPVLGYFPEAITAAQGDVVKFIFMQKNHTATQSTFADPCKKMDGGLDSGFKPNPDGLSGAEFEWEMTVPTTDALWFYCKQKTGVHCGKGMVFSINAKFDGEKTMAQFKQLAINKNGTEQAPLTAAGIQQVSPNAAAAPSTVIVEAGGALATGTGAAALATATVIAGAGTDGTGQACSCQCLCGVNSFPPQAAINNFGGFAGSITNGKAL